MDAFELCDSRRDIEYSRCVASFSVDRDPKVCSRLSMDEKTRNSFSLFGCLPVALLTGRPKSPALDKEGLTVTGPTRALASVDW